MVAYIHSAKIHQQSHNIILRSISVFSKAMPRNPNTKEGAVVKV